MDTGTFYSALLTRAKQDTFNFFRNRLMTAVILAIFGAAAGYVLGGISGVPSSSIAWQLIASVLGIVGIVVLVFTWNLIMTPVRTFNEQEQKFNESALGQKEQIQKLTARIGELETPKLKVVFDPTCTQCLTSSPNGNDVTLGIWNDTGRTISNVQVFVESFPSLSLRGKRQLPWVGGRLGPMTLTPTVESGHVHVAFIFISPTDNRLILQISGGACLPLDSTYVAKILVEGHNVSPVLQEIQINPGASAPITIV